MKKLVLLMMTIVLATPLAADAHTWKSHDRHHVSVSDNSTFAVEDGVLTLTHKDRHGKDRVVVTAEGDLTVNGDEVDTNRSERRLLKKFYRESAELDELATGIAADAEEIASASTQYATAQVSAALRSLTGDKEEIDETEEKEIEAMEARFEREIASIEEFADQIEEQADKVVGIAEQLQEQIPELEEFEWFLDD